MRASRRTSIGYVTISEDDGRITELSFGDCGNAETNGTLEDAFSQLDEYLAGKRRTFDLDYSLEGTEFQKKVWNSLRKIPYGRTISYHEEAEMIGEPKACRAVGSANGRNPIAIFIPCHRVIGSDGTLGGYSSGLEIKKKLLELEGAEWTTGRNC